MRKNSLKVKICLQIIFNIAQLVKYCKKMIIIALLSILGFIAGFLLAKTKCENYYRPQIQDLKNDQTSKIIEIENLKNKLLLTEQIAGESKKIMSTEFENLANKIFDQKSEVFKKQSNENITQILSPLQDKIKDFKLAFEDKIYKQSQEQISLKEEIKRIVNTNQEMVKAAENLTTALKGDSKQQGDWGEQVLETILENSGLQKGINYHTQHNTKDEDGSNLRPDIVISLPDDKKIILDSKVSLTSYEKYTSAENEVEKLKSSDDFLISIKNHIRGLSKKDYQKHLNGNSLDFVIMFMPIDATFFLAMQRDQNLFNEALRQNIVISSPTTLIPIIKTISQMWRVDNQIKNVQEITKKAASLYDKLDIFVEKFVKIGNNIASTAKSYDEAIKTLCKGNGNALRQAEELKRLGIPVSKNISDKTNSLDLAEKNIEEIIHADYNDKKDQLL
jgi:DNA recombination protein RmuC